MTSNDIIDLRETTAELLGQAHANGTGRAARALIPGEREPLKQTVLAIAAGETLAEHTAHGSATIYILSGEGTLESDGASTPLLTGEWAKIPRTAHSVHASVDMTALRTIAPD